MSAHWVRSQVGAITYPQQWESPPALHPCVWSRPNGTARHRTGPSPHTQGFFKRPALPIPPAPGPTGQTMGKLHDETSGALRIHGLRELLPDGDGAREAVDSDVHSALAWEEGRPCLPHLIPPPYCLSRQTLQQQKRPTAQRRRHHQRTLVVFERSHHRMQVSQPCGDRNRPPGRLRPLTPRVGVQALRKEQLQPRPAIRDLLDAFTRRLQAVALRVIDDAPPLRDLVVIGISDPDAPLGDEPLDQCLRLRPPGARDGPLAIGRPRLGRLRRLTAVGDRKVVVDHQEPTIPLASA